MLEEVGTGKCGVRKREDKAVLWTERHPDLYEINSACRNLDWKGGRKEMETVGEQRFKKENAERGKR